MLAYKKIDKTRSYSIDPVCIEELEEDEIK
jgi:hypothetical protein